MELIKLQKIFFKVNKDFDTYLQKAKEDEPYREESFKFKTELW
jgi:hypothetical protein